MPGTQHIGRRAPEADPRASQRSQLGVHVIGIGEHLAGVAVAGHGIDDRSPAGGCKLGQPGVVGLSHHVHRIEGVEVAGQVTGALAGFQKPGQLGEGKTQLAKGLDKGGAGADAVALKRPSHRAGPGLGRLTDQAPDVVHVGRAEVCQANQVHAKAFRMERGAGHRL